MTKTNTYRTMLNTLDNWDSYLLQESGLPGPRGNIELAQVVADQGNRELFERYLAYTADKAPTNSSDEFLAFCGVVGFGRLLAEGERDLLKILRVCASDPRWRIREAVAMALQRWGAVEMEDLILAMQDWSRGTLLEKRAAAAGLCEPRLLKQPQQTAAVLQILDRITASIMQITDRRHPDFKVLRKGLGYCWSVAVVALPEPGKALMEKWLHHPDKDIHWIMMTNLKKARLSRMDRNWVKQCLVQK